MANTYRLSDSLEDYLKVILDLEGTQKVARAKDIAEKMNVQRGSVTNALKSLEEKGLVNYAPYSFTTLTNKGKEIAEEISHRRDILKILLIKLLNVEDKTAENTVCRMEHTIDKKTLERLIVFFDFINKCPRAGDDWIQAFGGYCSNSDPQPKQCEQCLEHCRVSLRNREPLK